MNLQILKSIGMCKKLDDIDEFFIDDYTIDFGKILKLLLDDNVFGAKFTIFNSEKTISVRCFLLHNPVEGLLIEFNDDENITTIIRKVFLFDDDIDNIIDILNSYNNDLLYKILEEIDLPMDEETDIDFFIIDKIAYIWKDGECKDE